MDEEKTRESSKEFHTEIIRPAGEETASGRIGRFHVQRILGEGGMGRVLLALDTQNQRLVAIKVMKEAFARNPEHCAEFVKEARYMQRMDHPNILHVLELVEEAEAGPHYVMPYIDGGSLAARLSSRRPLPLEELLPIAEQVADALCYAHDRQGYIHRDLKPENVLLDHDGTAYLCDFGLVRSLFNETMVTPESQPHWTIGTRPYMPPEVVAGKASDTRADIYSFGAMLYEACSGQRPYNGQSTEEIFTKIKLGPPVSIREYNPGLPEGMVTIIEGAMGRELRDRYASMADVLADIQRFRRGQAPLGPHGLSAQTEQKPPDVEEACVEEPRHGDSDLEHGSRDRGAQKGKTRTLAKRAAVAAAVLVVIALGYGSLHRKQAQTNTPASPPQESQRTDPTDEGLIPHTNDGQSLPASPKPEPARPTVNPGQQPDRPPESVSIDKIDEQLSKALQDGDDALAIQCVDRFGSIQDKNSVLRAFPIREAIKYQRIAVVSHILQVPVGADDLDGDDTLHKAAETNKVVLIEALVKNGHLDVDQKNAEGQTPLVVAAVSGRKEAVTALLKLGADKNAVDKEDTTPLHAAVERHQREVVKVLLAHGVDTRVRRQEKTAREWAEINGDSQIAADIARSESEKDGIYPLRPNASPTEIAARLSRALQGGDDAFAIQCVDKLGSLRDQAVVSEALPIREAIKYRRIAVVSHILQVPVGADDLDGNNTLHNATETNKVALIEALVQKGHLEPDQKNADGQTPLILAAVSGRNEAVTSLLKLGANKDTADAGGMTPLHAAVEGRHAQVVTILLQEGADTEIRWEGKTARERAETKGYVEIVRLFDELLSPWNKRVVSVPGMYYILKNMAVVRLTPLNNGQCQMDIAFATKRPGVAQRIRPLREEKSSFDFDGHPYDVTVHEYRVERQQAVVTLKPRELVSADTGPPLSCVLIKEPAQYIGETQIRLENGVRIGLADIVMRNRAPTVPVTVAFPKDSTRTLPPANLKQLECTQFSFDGRDYFVDVHSLNPDSRTVTAAVRVLDRPAIGTPLETAKDIGHWDRQRLDVPGAYYILNNMAVVTFRPHQAACHVVITFVSERNPVGRLVRSPRDVISFPFGGTEYSLTVHDYNVDRQQAVATLKPVDTLVSGSASFPSCELTKEPTEYAAGTQIRLDNGIELSLGKINWQNRTARLPVGVDFPKTSIRERKTWSLEALASQEFTFDNVDYFVDVHSLNPDRQTATIAVRTYNSSK